jgi:hypothetical protein
MSKKKGKPAAKQAPKKKGATRRSTKKPAARPRSSARLQATQSEPAVTGITAQATIFIFRTSHGNRIRTSPQRIYGGPGHVEWTVVNMIDGSDVPVTITWPQGGPWGKEPIAIRSWERRSLEGAPAGRYKYVVSALDAQEDPELEIPDI